MRLSCISYKYNSSINIKMEDVYKDDDVYIFKGEEPDNYLYFSNFLWRIISINSDGSIDIVTNDYINILKNISYDVNKYVNDVFLDVIDKKYLNKVSYCNDIVTYIEKNNCIDIRTNDYVRLPSTQDIINSLDNGKSYLLNDLEYWLNDRYNDNPFIVMNNKITNGIDSDMYEVRPVVRLRGDIVIENGDGSLNNPYVVSEEEKNFRVGNYVMLEDDIWVIYEEHDGIVKLALDNSKLGFKAFGNNSYYDIDDSKSIGNFLNDSYLNSLSYKDILIDTKWEIGSYNNSYEDISSKVISSKVGMLNVKDLKLVNNSDGYYLITPKGDDEVYFYSTNSFVSKTNYLRSIVPTISIKSDYKVHGIGTRDNPLEIEV